MSVPVPNGTYKVIRSISSKKRFSKEVFVECVVLAQTLASKIRRYNKSCCVQIDRTSDIKSVHVIVNNQTKITFDYYNNND